MATQVYTLGYSGRTPQELAEIVDRLDAILFDIRYTPQSRVPHWNRGALLRLFGSARYRHVQAFGNAAYKTGGIEIANFRAGEALLRDAERPVILLCGCPLPTDCHRTIVGAQLRALGYAVEELPPPVKRISRPKGAAPTNGTGHLFTV